MTAALRVGSLFTGYGGLDMAVRQVLGGELAWVSDNHPSAVKLLTERYPGVPNLGDITGIDWTEVEPVDVLAGGFPCQDLSLAGVAAGLMPGTRSGLWQYMADAINALRPRLVVIENVRGLCSAPAHSNLEPCPWCVGDNEGVPLRALGAVLGDLADLRYDAVWCGLRAADVGAPHGRFRVFVVAVPSVARGVAPNPAGDGRDQGRAEPARVVGGPDAALGSGHAAPDTGRDARQEDHQDGSATAGCGGAAADTSGVGHGNTGEAGVGGVPAAAVAGGERSPAADSDGARQQQREGDQSDLAERADDGPESDLDWAQFTAAIRRWEVILGRAAPAPTEPGRRGQPVLSPAFVEHLMGLDAGHVIGVPGLSRTDMLRLLGNGVVPQQGAAALRYLLASLTSVSAA